MGAKRSDKRRFGFKIDNKRLEEICLKAYEFGQSEGIKKYLPQFNLPEDLEHRPRRIETANPLQAPLYLWTCVFFERITKSSQTIKNALRIWDEKSKNWIFNPREVAQRSLPEIEEILTGDFQFNLQGLNEEPPEERFLFNAKHLVDNFGGDPRNLIRYNTVKQARDNLMEFKGIGTGISNLFIIYLMEREIISPRDPENALLKVDVHKGRIPINCGAVRPTNGQIARDEFYVDTMEKAYREVCRKYDLDAKILDAALWVIGSEICAKRNYGLCNLACAAFTFCEAYTPEDKETGRYTVLTRDGERIDGRRNKSQAMMEFKG
jgi:hypothetical protein